MSAVSGVDKLIIDSSYEDIARLITATVDAFIVRYQGKGCFWNRDDLVQEARIIWLRKIKKYRRHRSAFTTWTRLVVWGGLLELLRKEIYRNNRFTRTYVEDISNVTPAKRYEFDVDILMDSLSVDARYVAALALQQPYEIVFNAKLLGDVTDLGSALWDHLIGIGWNALRIQIVWNEIRRAK